MIAVFGLVVGILAGLLLEPSVPVSLQPYLPIAVVAALDAVFGGLRAYLDGIFDDKVFVVSFVSNVLADKDGQARWCDDVRTKRVESCEDVLNASLERAVHELQSALYHESA